jgi:hypothetical protein
VGRSLFRKRHTNSILEEVQKSFEQKILIDPIDINFDFHDIPLNL